MKIRCVTAGAGRLQGVDAPVGYVVRIEQAGVRVVAGEGREGAGGADVGRRHRRRVHVHARILLLPLRPPVLEPDLHLRLGEAEAEGEVEALADAQVAGGLELVLQGHQLLVGEGGPGPARFARVLRLRVGLFLLRVRVLEVVADVALHVVVIVRMVLFPCKQTKRMSLNN